MLDRRLNPLCQILRLGVLGGALWGCGGDDTAVGANANARTNAEAGGSSGGVSSGRGLEAGRSHDGRGGSGAISAVGTTAASAGTTGAGGGTGSGGVPTAAGSLSKEGATAGTATGASDGVAPGGNTATAGGLGRGGTPGAATGASGTETLGGTPTGTGSSGKKGATGGTATGASGTPASGGPATTGGATEAGEAGGATEAGEAGGAIEAGGTNGTGGLATTGGMPGSGGRGASTGGGNPPEGGSSAGGNATGLGGDGSGPPGDTESITCPSPALEAGDTTKTIQVGSQSRSYILHVPAQYDGSEPAPLVLDFHGMMGSATEERSGSPYPAKLDPEGVIMAFPQGLEGPAGAAWNVKGCCVADDVDDVAFAKAVVADTQKVACIDPKRIYAVGHSLGGGLSHYLACHAADVFAAVAPSAFDLTEQNAPDCKPSRPISVVFFRGTADSLVTYAGGHSAVVPGMAIDFLGAKGTLQKWAEINGCTGSPSAEDGQGCSQYSTCKDGVEVTLCTMQGAQHMQPGDPSVSWPILKAHPMP
ncbi:alpha/beta hydrolase family esterase [Myxococcota bacterium]